jgi:methylated-DNA-[protein]-cysteine S-methyltransferase
MTVPNTLDAEFRASAVRAGLLDAAYGVVETPIGDVLVATSAVGLLAIRFGADPGAYLERLARLAGSRVLHAPRAVDRVRGELDEYFAGNRTAFDLELDLRDLTPFTLAVLGELARVPFGETATYRDLAVRVGRPQASRAVGMVMNRNRIPIVLPCHRIVGSSGSLVGYAGGLETKERLLRLEGVLLS